MYVSMSECTLGIFLTQTFLSNARMTGQLHCVVIVVFLFVFFKSLLSSHSNVTH